MIAFIVEIDGVEVVTAGVEDWSILGLHVSAARTKRKEENSASRIDFSVGGLTLPDAEEIRYHFRWPTKMLSVGSVVNIRVVESESPDVPAKRYRSDSQIQESPFTEKEWRQMRYADYLALKAEFAVEPG